MEKSGGRNAVEVIKDEVFMREKILSELHEHPLTIPELASALGVPATEAMLWVMAMWRYGLLEEQGKADSDGYYKYQPAQ
jgi:DNA-binding IclR family transcriptional regulator